MVITSTANTNPVQNINSIAFTFNKAKITVKCDERNKYKKCSCDKCDKYKISNNICMIRLKKSEFLSSSLDVSTSPQDAWNSFTKRITSLLYGHFVITLGRNNKFYSIFAQLFKIKTYKDDSFILYFKYNFIPNNVCTLEPQYLITTNCPKISTYNNNWIDPNAPIEPSINVISFKPLHNCTYHNLKFYCDNSYVFAPIFATTAINSYT